MLSFVKHVPVELNDDFDQFVQKLKLKTGINLALYKENQMKRRLNNLKEKRGFKTFVDYFHAMMLKKELFLEFLDHMTINVSEFYRNPSRWEILEKQLLPELIAKRNGRIRCWSAACSTGEEPYSLAMVLSSMMKLHDIQVLATDIDQNAIDRAKRGIYQAQSVKDVPKLHLNRFFNIAGSNYEITDEIKRCITFTKHNLLAEPFELNFDLIICRNVLIYFTEEAKDSLFMKFSRSLVKGGYLFIGGTEQIFHPSNYHLEQVHTFFYRKI